MAPISERKEQVCFLWSRSEDEEALEDLRCKKGRRKALSQTIQGKPAIHETDTRPTEKKLSAAERQLGGKLSEPFDRGGKISGDLYERKGFLQGEVELCKQARRIARLSRPQQKLMDCQGIGRPQGSVAMGPTQGQRPRLLASGRSRKHLAGRSTGHESRQGGLELSLARFFRMTQRHEGLGSQGSGGSGISRQGAPSSLCRFSNKPRFKQSL